LSSISTDRAAFETGAVAGADAGAVEGFAL
jgi:hypothetical protein